MVRSSLKKVEYDVFRVKIHTESFAQEQGTGVVIIYGRTVGWIMPTSRIDLVRALGTNFSSPSKGPRNSHPDAK